MAGQYGALRQAGGACRTGTTREIGGQSRAGMSGVSVHIFQRNTALFRKSREPILLSKIESLKNRSFFKDDLKKLNYGRGP
jgi:hypothetical protein